MPLKAVLERLEDAPESIRALYVEREGKFFLDTEDFQRVTGAMEHERRQRAEAVKARDEHAQKLAALEAQLAEAQKAAHQAQAPQPGQDDIKAQLAQYKKEYDDRAAKLEKLIQDEKSKREAAERTVREGKLVDMLREARKAAGIADTAEIDFLNRAKPLYRENPESGEWEPFENGQPLYGFDEPSKIRTPVEVAREILKTAPHFKAPSGGGGASGSVPGGMNGVVRYSRTDMKNPAVFEKAKEQMSKGINVEITPQ